MPSPTTLLPLVLLTLNLLTPASARLGSPLGGGPGGGHGAVAKRASHHHPEQIVARSEEKRSGKKRAHKKAKSAKRAGANGKKLVRKRKTSNCVVSSSSSATVSTSPASSTLASIASAATSSSVYTYVLSTATASSSSSAPYVTTSSTVSNAQDFATKGSTAVSSSATSYVTSSSTTTTSTSTSTSTSSAATASSTSDWYLVEKWSGSNFFENFEFWDYTDPTHGTVNYVSSTEAYDAGLAYINSAGNAIMAVDTTDVVSTSRNSIRLQGNLVFTGGLVLMDAVHAPTGCGTWPAWWQNGPDWPYGGEIDIMEGINEFTQNQVSLHTGTGCTMPTTMDMQGSLTTGDYDSYDCASYDTANQGCGVRDATSDNSFGADFNTAGGGVYAMEWAKTGINVWFFTRSSIPTDITDGSPDPTTWGTPIANFPSTDCSPFEYFYDHFNIFDTTLCGDWAGVSTVWDYAGYAGQSESCASITGYSTCSDFVLNSGSSFSEAYWEVAYVAYYNSTTLV